MSAKVSVLVATRNSGLRDVLQNVLAKEQWIEVVGTSSNKDEALDQALKLSPRVVVLDRTITGNHLQTCEEIMGICPGVKVVVVGSGGGARTGSGPDTKSKKTKYTAEFLGAIEQLSTDSSPADLIRAVRGWRMEKTQSPERVRKGGEF